jgi:hypothetical protein
MLFNSCKITDCYDTWAEHSYTECKENIWAISNNNGNSEFSDHILNTGHAHGSITGTMQVIKSRGKKGQLLNTTKVSYTCI